MTVARGNSSIGKQEQEESIMTRNWHRRLMVVLAIALVFSGTVTALVLGSRDVAATVEVQLGVALPSVNSGTGLGSAQVDDSMHYFGVGEVTFQAATNSAVPMLATGWALEGDLSGGTMTIRDDVVFHGDGLEWAGGTSWGPMTSEDIAYTINDGNPEINPGSIHWQAGDFAAMFGANPVVATDDTTVQFTFVAFDPTWNSNLLNDAGQAFSVQSTAVRDGMGEQWMVDNPLISTGPFHVVESFPGDHLTIEAIPYAHWSGAGPLVDQITFSHVPDEPTRVALIEAGQVDAALLDLTSIPDILLGGFETADNGLNNLVSVVFSGNLWERRHAITGEPLDTSAVYETDLPWIGDPRDPADFEEATLVRNALARAYDRDLINARTQAGLGFPAYLNQFSPTNPNWQSKWEYEYDPVEAGNLLDQAGWPKDADGVRFRMSLYVPTGGDDEEIADAVAMFFNRVGVKTSVQKAPYSRFRPGLVDRTHTIPWVSQCDDGKSTWPWDWPKSADHTSITRGGFGCGVEILLLARSWLAAASEPDEAARIAINNRAADYLFEQAVSPGIVGQPAPITYNPNTIAAWPMSPGLFATVNDYEAIVPVP